MRGLVCSLAVAGCLSISSCALFKPKTELVPVVKTVRVEVPVVVMQSPPEALKACGKSLPGFRFYAPMDGSNDIIVREEDQDALKKWIEDKVTCLEAWRAWADGGN